MLKYHINAGNLWTLGEHSSVPGGADAIDYQGIKRCGFAGVQHYFPEAAALEAGLEMSGMARIVEAKDALPTAKQHAEWGFVASTWHVGTGFESEHEMDALAEAVLDAQSSAGIPIFIETHRATITQDMRRTLDLIDRYPALRFNADLSHWYSGLEMTYGDLDAKLKLLQPVFERVGYMHGRIGHSCTMQLPLRQARDHQCWDHYKTMWTMCLDGFYVNRPDDEDLIFAPELLPAQVQFGGETHVLNYAQEIEGAEVSDRWEEALELLTLMDQLNAKSSSETAIDQLAKET